MMVHLDVEVDDLARAVAWAEQCGARLAEHQPQADVRVCLDPDGRPFCLYVEADAGQCGKSSTGTVRTLPSSSR